MTHYEAVYAALLRNDLSPHQHWVYTALVSFWNSETGRCDPSIDTIAGRAKVSKSATKAALRQLKELGLVLPFQRRIGTTNLSNSYRLPGVGGAPLGHSTPHLGQVMPQGRAQDAPGVGHSTPPNKEHEQRREQRTTSSRKREKEIDPRFQEFVSALKTYWVTANADIPFDFTADDGKALNTLLGKRRSLDLKTLRTWLNNRFHSEAVNHGEEIFVWLPRIAKYAAGPLNRYQQPLGGSNGDRTSHSGNNSRNRGQERTDALKSAAAGAYQDLLGGTGATRPM